MNTIREEIILELLARAAVIRATLTPLSYSTDCGAHVFRMRPKVAPADAPCITVWPEPETAVNAHGMSKHTMPVSCEGIAEFGTADPSVIGEKILGDLIKCFTSPAWDRTRDGVPTPPDYIESIVYTVGGYEPPEDGSKTVGVKALFTVIYNTAVGDPYTL